ncbi:MAG: restriction endonuclease [Burkholderiaceae bacterium]|nr:restriction endonuclease [Burkholderiaceae bacterium]
MKFKMAPNSLFAILLRSPWWISLGIALAFGLVSRAALPETYWTMGAMGGFPFLILAAMALRRQMRAPTPKQVEAILARVATLSWREFADALEKALATDGAQVTRLEGAADFAVVRGSKTQLVAAKRWKAARLGEDSLEALHAAVRQRDASEAMVISLGDLSANAQRYAKAHHIEVVQGAALAQLLRNAGL